MHDARARKTVGRAVLSVKSKGHVATSKSKDPRSLINVGFRVKLTFFKMHLNTVFTSCVLKQFNSAKCPLNV